MNILDQLQIILFKEEIKVYGVKTSIVTRIAKEYYKTIGTMKKEDVFYYVKSY